MIGLPGGNVYLAVLLLLLLAAAGAAVARQYRPLNHVTDPVLARYSSLLWVLEENGG